MSGNIGSDIVIECSAVADPAPDIKWYKSDTTGSFLPVSDTEERIEFGSIIGDSNHYSFTLTLRDVGLQDHDVKYFCKLSNKLGEETSPKYTILVNHIECQSNKVVQEKIFNVQEPAQIACPQSLSSHPKDTSDWLYNNSER